MSDPITRNELNQRDEALRAEIARVQRESVQRDMELTQRVNTIEAAALDIRRTVLDARDDLFQKFEEANEARAQQTLELKDALATVARVKQYERVASTLFGLALNLPFLRWLRWLLAVLGGVALAVLVVSVLMR